ncbi:hydroxysteroid dehydrogenase-like protein 2 [Holotrichia oblita]|uniref:Hydroxysteroid dehydrogenase-like protein 2 n=1 Tax=Holotrichia oblita TaxID=644536 RepID=A0ACB9SQU6_HOLOL|nr:hydroxysteroid dehydrogenase-like protein 2 [Holotrichia oblita]
MMNTGKLNGLTLFITGASRGIGKAIALKAAKDGANIVVAAKTAIPHPKLPGTIFTAAQEIEEAGGKALALEVDVRNEQQIKSAVEEAAKKFGGIDILINNASAISLTGTAETEMKRYDLMHQINTRGTFLVSKECLPYLKKSKHAHILNISPPLNMSAGWFSPSLAYTMAKYGMSMCVLGMHEELRNFGIGVNALWPRTLIHTAATEMLQGKDVEKYSRKPEIMGDAAYAILIQDPKQITGNFFIDDDVLRNAGITNLDQYACNLEFKDELLPDGFVDEEPSESFRKLRPSRIKNNTPTAAGGSNKVDFLFSVIQKSLNEELVSKTRAMYQFNLTGEDSGIWYLDLKNGSGSYGNGESPQKADATLTMDSKNFFALFEGKLKASNAYMLGKLKITGSLQKAIKLDKLMGKLKSKM